MSKQIDKYAVFGNPIGHSKSPLIHSQFAKQTQQQMTYEAIEAPIDDFENTVKAFLANSGKGCNITVPFKEQAWRLAEQLSPRAKLAGAVNTLKLTDDGILLGDNTDGAGLVGDIVSQWGDIADKRILLLGAGGAARGCILPLLEKKPKELVIANRTQSKAEALAQMFSSYGDVAACGFKDLSGEFDLIINSTSASLSGQLPPIDAKLVSGADCYDMMYGSELTAFLLWAKDNGAKRILDGLGMLVGQAAESFCIWRGIRPSARSVLRELRQQLKG